MGDKETTAKKQSIAKKREDKINDKKKAKAKKILKVKTDRIRQQLSQRSQQLKM